MLQEEPPNGHRHDTDLLALAATLLAGTTLTQGAGPAFAEATPGNTALGVPSNAPMPGAGSGTGATPGMGVMDSNQSVVTTGADVAEAAGRAIGMTLGTNTTGANPGGTSAVTPR